MDSIKNMKRRMKIKGFGINGESLTDTSEKHYYAIIDVET
jgi:hypothetical protein